MCSISPYKNVFHWASKTRTTAVKAMFVEKMSTNKKIKTLMQRYGKSEYIPTSLRRTYGKYLLGHSGPGCIQGVHHSPRHHSLAVVVVVLLVYLYPAALLQLLLQLLADVPQDAELQGGQRGSQVGPADVALGQPLQQRVGEGRLVICAVVRGVSLGEGHQLVAVQQGPELLPHLGAHLGEELTTEEEEEAEASIRRCCLSARPPCGV